MHDFFLQRCKYAHVWYQSMPSLRESTEINLHEMHRAKNYNDLSHAFSGVVNAVRHTCARGGTCMPASCSIGTTHLRTADAGMLCYPGQMHMTGAHPSGVQQVVRAGGLDDLGLLLNCEVGPRELRVNVLLVQLHDLVVADCARVGVVHDACQAPPCLHMAWQLRAETLTRHARSIRDGLPHDVMLGALSCDLAYAGLVPVLKQEGSGHAR